MQFTKLRLLGFKSFVEPQEFVIERGLTGVVGPNGCGKSNLVEALRWVMGENSYKNMRASGMDDVIFSGSNTRPARNSAEVTLFLNNHDHTAPPAFNEADELQVSRRIEREQGSNYRINGKDVRAKDVQLLFADQSTGARSPSMVGQGRIGELIQAKPQARRALLEEAAGISGLHTRRHEAELRLRAAETNLDRLEDVVGDLSGRIESLKRQARQANRFKSLSSNIREIEAGLYYLRWSQAKTQEIEAESELTRTTSAVAEKAQRHMRSEKARDQGKDILPPLREEAAKAAAAHQRLQLAARQLDDESERNRQRLSELMRRLEQMAQDLAREEQILQENSDILLRLEEEEASLKALVEDSGIEEAECEARFDEATQSLAEQEQALQIKTAERASVLAEKTQLERSLGDMKERREKLATTIVSIEKELQVLAESLVQNGDIEAARQAVENAEAILAESEIQVENCAETLSKARQDVLDLRRPVHEAEAAVNRLETEAETLDTLLKAASDEAYPPILDALVVEQGYEAALGAALGDGLLAALDSAAPVFWQKRISSGDHAPLPEGVEPLSKYVKAPTELQKALSAIGLVHDEQGAMLCPSLGDGQILVSIEGALWRWDGLTARADAPTAAAQRLAQKNRLIEIANQLLQRRQTLEAAIEKLALAETRVGKAENAEKDARNQVLNDRRNRESAMQQFIEAEKRSHEILTRQTALQETYEAYLHDQEEIAQKYTLLEDQFAQLPPIENLDQDIAAKTSIVVESRAAQAQARVAFEGLRHEMGMRQKRLEMIAQERRNWILRGENARKQIAILTERREDALVEMEALQAAPDDMEARRQSLLDEMAKTETSGKLIMDRLAEAENAQSQLEKTMAEAFAILSQAREERARAEERLNAAADRRQDIEGRITEALACPPQDVMQMAGFKIGEALPDIETLEHQFERLKIERERLGAVNLRAEEEGQELRDRYDAMTVERDDVIEAIKKLRHAIQSLNREGRERLLAAFEKVNSEFQRLFSHLFGGGEAELQLIESEDPLDAGLEILARPPGKKPQTMTLLSGGEQALTAMALIFAVFLTNPAPICVLDEVDAPLDDHNVERYCNLMDEMAASTETRFVVITHNPITMARMNRLFGVTMGEQGVSQLVSVDLQTAEKLTDAG